MATYSDTFWDLSRTRIDLHRPLTSYYKVQKLISLLIRNRIRPKVAEGTYAEIGPGASDLKPGFHSIDYHWIPGVTCWDVAKGLPYPDNWLGGVFTEHMVEHIPIEKAAQLFKEVHRVLKPGARVRIVVPSLELYARNFLAGLIAPGELPRAGVCTPAMTINRVFYDYAHRFIYDFETMAQLLRNAGFVNVAEAQFRQGSDPKLLVDLASREDESLYVEAQKPTREAPRTTP